MTNMDYLALQGNNLQGTLPYWLGDLEVLRVLGLGSNNFEETIPFELSKLTNLITLGLDDNFLTGNVEPVHKLVSLKRLYLENNDFQSNLDSLVTDMKELEELDLSSNRFEGAFPDYLFRLSSLKILGSSRQ